MARPSTCILSFAVGAVSVWVWSHPAAAIEPGQSLQTKPGVAFGVSAAPLPPGLYMIDDVFNYEFKLSGPGTVTTGNVPRGFAAEATGYFLWYPGWSFLGATYSALAAFPFLAVSVENVPAAGFPGVSFSGVHNTFIAPLRLQWNLGNGFFAQAGVGIYVPDGTIGGPLGDSNAGAPYYTVQPDLVLSYVTHGWNLTAYTYYEYNTKNQRSAYTSGDIFHADLTATKQFGKWTVGPVAYYVGQITSDRPSAGFDASLSAAVPVPGGIHGFNAGRFDAFALGGLAGYNFGSAALTVFATNNVFARAYGGNSGTPLTTVIPFTNETTSKGWTYFARLSYPLWNPEPEPAPKRR